MPNVLGLAGANLSLLKGEHHRAELLRPPPAAGACLEVVREKAMHRQPAYILKAQQQSLRTEAEKAPMRVFKQKLPQP